MSEERKPETILCVGAHPDDVEMAMGGTVAAFVEAGHEVHFLYLTRGELGTFGDAHTRVAEAEAAAEQLGVSLTLLDRPDGGVQDTLAERHEMARRIREVKPTLLFAPYPFARTGPLDGRANVDHLATGTIVREASKLARFRRLMPEIPPHAVRRLLYYMAPDDRMPSYVVDVSDQRARIEAAIRAYASQMPISRGGRSILEVLMIARQSWGLRIGVELAEPFVCEDALGGKAETLLRL